MFVTLKRILTLSGPLVASQVLFTASNFASHYIFVSQDPDFLAALSVIGNSQTFLLQIPDASLYMISNIASYALAENKLERLGPVFRSGHIMAFIICVPQTLFLNLLPLILRRLNQPQKVVEAITIYAPWYTIGATLTTFNIVNKRFLAGIRKQNILFASAIFSSIIRGALVYLLVPQDGIRGYAIAENLYIAVDFSILFFYLLRIQKTRVNNYKLFQISFEKKELFTLLRLGYPLVVKWSVISGMVYYMDFLTGRTGANALSAAGIVRQYYAWPLGIFVGFSDAVGILISEAFAQKDFSKVFTTLKNGLCINLTCATIFSIFFTSSGKQLASYFSENNENQDDIEFLSQSLFYVHIGWLLADSIRSMFDNYFNGLHKPKTPMWANLISLPLIFMLTYVLGFVAFKDSVVGITLGACLASLCETMLIGWMWRREDKALAQEAQQLLNDSEIGNQETEISQSTPSLKNKIYTAFFKKAPDKTIKKHAYEELEIIEATTEENDFKTHTHEQNQVNHYL